MLQILRIVALLEGLSFLILIAIAMPMKYILEMPGAVKIPGMAHGVLFVGYILLAIIVGIDKKWDGKQFTIVMLGAILPGGTFYADAKVFKS